MSEPLAWTRLTGSIHFPGSRQYGSVGEIENDVPAGTDAADIVKVIGTKEAIAKAKESLEVCLRTNAADGRPLSKGLLVRMVVVNEELPTKSLDLSLSPRNIIMP